MTIINKPVYFLIILNILTLIALLVISFHYDLPRKVLNIVGINSANYTYTDNDVYKIQRSMFEIYKPKKVKVVMLGDSITYGANWNELLSRTDVVNRGVGRDITEGFINRLSDIYKLNPEICFIMGGINDINLAGIPINDVFANITEIAEKLMSNNITPIIQSTLFISSKRYNWKITNEKVNELNRLLENYAKTHNVDFIDVNKQLLKNGALNPEYTSDGIHLLGNGYAKWRDLILPKL